MRTQWKYYSELISHSLRTRPSHANEQYNFLNHLFLFKDLLSDPDDPPPTDKISVLRVPYVELSLLVPEWLGFMLCNFVGVYPAAARTLRWIYESSLASAAAVLNSSVFPEVRGKSSSLTETQFRRWLRLNDLGQAKFQRKLALRALGLGLHQQTSLDELYRELCKYAHISGEQFAEWSTPDIVFSRTYFDRISRLASRTMDLTLYCLVRSISSQWDIKRFLIGYSSWFHPRDMMSLRRARFPLTLGIIQLLTS
jgi:hypothetical protein